MLNLLQIYRGYAALLVVMFHASARLKLVYGVNNSSFLNLFDFGDSGVQFFFVLSGFIIYHIHHNDIGRPEKVIPFLRKRIIRIYPIYIFITLLVFPVWYFVPSIGFEYHKDFSALFYSLLLIPQKHAPHLSIAWTLTHEMLFYLIFCIIILNRNAGKLLFCVWSCSIIYANLFVSSPLQFPVDFFFSINNILFVLGIFAAIVMNNVRFSNFPAILLFVSGNLLFLGTGMYSNYLKASGISANALPHIVIVLLGLASFLIITQANNHILEKGASQRKIRLLLGNASYSIYLFHLPVLSFIVRLFSFLQLEVYLPIWILFILAVISATIAGIVVHILVEQPLLNRLRRKWVYNYK